MKHAIIIFIHQLPEQVNTFIDQILRSTNMDIYIHINTRYDHIRPKIMKHERVFIADNCVPICWSDDGLFLAICQMFRNVLSSGKKYGHVLLCSGQDLLVRGGIDDYLDKNPSQVFLFAKEADKSRRVFILHKYPRIFQQLLDKKYDPRKIARSVYMRLIRKFPNLFVRDVNYDVSRITFYYSTFWGALPYAVVKYIINRLDTEDGLFDLYKGSFIPEESFLATLVMDSQFKDCLKFDENGVSSSLTYISRVENGHPLIIGTDDIDMIEKSGYFFARKFDIRTQPEVIDYFLNKTRKD